MTNEKRPKLGEWKTSKPPVSRAGSTITQLLLDIEPFFYARPVVYLDAGAHEGNVFREIYTSSLALKAAHLIEPNPASFAALRNTVRELEAEAVAVCHNVALAEVPQRLRLRSAGTMTKVISNTNNLDVADGQQSFEVEATTLDTIFEALPRSHASILKVDVEGYEREVFQGAKALLGAQAIDLIYVEAGMDPAGTQQTYYRDVEDTLRAYGYRLFRIYEQTHEWKEDSPFLRRVNLAFMSQTFAARNPYRLSHKLFAAYDECKALKRALAESEAAREAAEGRLASLGAAHQAEIAAQTARAVDAEAGRLAAEGRLASLGAAHQAEIAAQTARAGRLAASHAEALAKRDTALANAHQRLETQENKASKLEASLAVRSKEIAHLTKLLEAANKKINALTRSTSWRLMAPARGIADMVRRQR